MTLSPLAGTLSGTGAGALLLLLEIVFEFF